MMRFGKWSWILLLLAVSGMAQGALINDARVVSASKSLASMLPAASTVNITTADTYTLTLSDVQGQSGPGNPFSSLSVVIYQNSLLVKQLALPASTFTANSTVTLAAGQYQVQVLGVTPGASQYGVDLKNSTNVSVWNNSGTITAPVANNFSTLQQSLALTAGQSYTVTLSDRVFPVALTSLQSVITQGGNPPVCALTAVGATASCSFVASAAGNQLVVLAQEATSSAGLYSVKVTNTTTGATAYAGTFPMGTMPDPITVTLPANDAYALSSIDFINPVALSSFKLALVQGGDLLVKQTSVGGPVTFNASSGATSLFIVPTAASASAGSYSVLIKRGSASVFTQVDSVTDSVASGIAAYVFKATLPAAGNYSLQLRDFVYPQAFTTLSANVSQDGIIFPAGTLAAPGTLTINNAVAGEINIVVLATPASSAAGLFGLTLTATGSTTPVLEKTQGVGASFTSQTVTVPAAAHYSVTATDFVAPAALDQLRVAVTRGASVVGQIFGGGTFGFDATPGDYTINFITTAKATPGYGMFGVSLLNMNLSSNVSSVTSGGSVTLTWSSDSDGCVASGGWTGNKAASGTATVGPLSANSTFTLTCSSGAGGAAKSIDVAVTAAPASASKGGGGSVSLEMLLMLGGLVGARQLRRTRLG